MISSNVWAWEELNLRPHAYQACGSKGRSSYLRALHHLPSARFRAIRKKSRDKRAQKRRQRVDKGGDLGPADSVVSDPGILHHPLSPGERAWVKAEADRRLDQLVFGKAVVSAAVRYEARLSLCKLGVFRTRREAEAAIARRVASWKVPGLRVRGSVIRIAPLAEATS
jgi:hypothetical protein